MDNEMAEVNLGRNGEVVEQSSKIALIDADTVVFAACTVLEYVEDLMPRDFYSEEEWEEILLDPGYVEEDQQLWNVDLDEAMAHSMEKINDILDLTGCTEYELHFTAGRESFRYKDVLPTYKSNRKGRAPKGIVNLREKLAEQPNAFIHRKWEADDIVVALRRDNPDKYIMCAVDKDLLYSIEGKHFNYYRNYKYDIDMKWVEVDAITAMKHPFMQTLTGDPTDGVIGLKGIGPKKAEKLLAGLTTEAEMWEAVQNAYRANGRDIIDALNNMRLVHMHQLQLNDDGEYEVKLWRP